MKRRSLFVAAALTAVVGLHAAVGWAWMSDQGELTAALCCDTTGGSLEQIRWLHAQTSLSHTMPWQPGHGTLALIGAQAWALGQAVHIGPRFGLLALLLAALIAQLLLFEIGRRLSGAWAGVLAAALLPFTPIIAHAERRWDIAGAQLPLILSGFLLVLLSRGLSRPLAAAAFAAVVVAGGCFSPRETDNLLMVFALGSMAGGALLRNLVLGRDQAGRRVSRPWNLLIGIATVALSIAGLRQVVHFSSKVGAHYYLDELQLFWASADWAPFAYTSHLYWRGLTPTIATLTTLAAVLVALRGRARAEMAAWVLVPLVALSVLPKRNFYYISVIYPALPLVLALGIAALPRRWMRVGAALIALALGGVQVTARSFPDRVARTPLAGLQWMGGNARMGGWFQTSDHDLALAAVPRPDLDALTADILAHTTVDACACPIDVSVGSVGEPAELGWRLSVGQPCLQVLRSPVQSDTGFALRNPREPGIHGFIELQRTRDLALYARPAEWFSNHCR